MKATKENYREVLDEIAYEYKLHECTSVSARNGYPEGILPLLDGLESEEQAEEILAKYPQAELFELQWKAGWTTKYRLNHLSCPRCYEADDELKYDNDILGLWRKGDDVEEFEVFFLGEGLQDQAEELIRDLQDLGLRIDKPVKKYEDCAVVEYQEFYNRADVLITDMHNNDDDKEVPQYIDEELEEIKKKIDEVVELRKELLALKEDEVLRIDLDHCTRVIDEKSMSYYDGDVTYKCIAIGFDPDNLPSEDEEE